VPRLAGIVERAPDRSFVEPDADVRRAAADALARVDTREACTPPSRRCSSA
jgi:hypothetical protein